MESEERKEFVKSQREKFKKDPGNFISEVMIKPTIQFWKEEPLRAAGTFLFWIAIYYIIFGMIQAINNDMIYCDSTINRFDGKLMDTYNSFVDYYNRQALTEGMGSEGISIQEGEMNLKEFNVKYSMLCNYNLTRWNNEKVTDRGLSIGRGFMKIILKQR